MLRLKNANKSISITYNFANSNCPTKVLRCNFVLHSVSTQNKHYRRKYGVINSLHNEQVILNPRWMLGEIVNMR